jgi:hypothetical protein
VDFKSSNFGYPFMTSCTEYVERCLTTMLPAIPLAEPETKGLPRVANPTGTCMAFVTVRPYLLPAILSRMSG